MIFVTIGSMFPFDRMIREMDAWVASRMAEGDAEEILAQIGEGTYVPRNMTWVRRLDRADYIAAVARARLIVAHAGIGSVVSAGEQGKPVVILPRRESFGEHTSDHQVETAGRLRGRCGIYVADRESDLATGIAAAQNGGGSGGSMSGTDPAFIARIRAFILDGPG